MKICILAWGDMTRTHVHIVVQQWLVMFEWATAVDGRRRVSRGSLKRAAKRRSYAIFAAAGVHHMKVNA